jgi:superfamily I DNA/RNA helicase
MKCKECGSEMILRTSKFNTGLFWGCSAYPICKSTQRYSDEADQVAIVTPTSEQTAIFQYVKARMGNLIVQAVAGSGKTTTLLQSLRFVPPSFKSVFLAFNRSIAETLAKRAPSHIEVRTLHSLGLKFIKRRWPDIELDSNKMEKIFETLFGDTKTGGYVQKIYSLCLNNDVQMEAGDIEEIIEYYDMDEIVPIPDLVHMCGRMMTEARRLWESGTSVSFDELIALPARKIVKSEPYDTMFIDECQDLNKLQMRFILNCTSPQTMVVCVGDRAQSIYGFRGADTNAMDYLKQQLNADELPLSVCFRCPVSHITIAQKYVPQIQPRPGAPLGDIFDTDLQGFLTKVQKEDLVISRTNAPLLPLAFSLIRMNKPAFVKGRDIAKAITDMLRKEMSRGIEGAVEHIVDLTNKKVEKLTEQNKLAQAAYALDICDCCLYFLQSCGALVVSDAIDYVSRLFDESGVGIILSSIHKAKGLEASRVFIINPESMPLPVKLSWERQQERNLVYVASTRATDTIFYTHLPR